MAENFAADLATLDGLAVAVERDSPVSGTELDHVGAFDGTFCASCGAVRRMQLVTLFWTDRWAPGKQGLFPQGSREEHADEDPSPALYIAVCVQCDAQLVLLVHQGPGGVELIALPQTYGGLATPNTPAAVSYYLDQAQRSQAVSARSAAVAMYRAALESLLYAEGLHGRAARQQDRSAVGRRQPARLAR